MAVHDWTGVGAGTFHAFHTAWVTHLSETLNGGLLPRGYYALPEQHLGRSIADVLTLRSGSPVEATPAGDGGVAVAEAPPRTSRHLTVSALARTRRRTLSIRHVSGHRIVAMVEIISPANKDRLRHVEDFTAKAVAALGSGINLLLVDLFPPGPHDPQGMHGAIWSELDEDADPYDLPLDAPLTLACYLAVPEVESYLEHVKVGDPLPEMPLFLHPERYVKVPLESTYQAAFRGLPAYWRGVLEGAAT